MTSNQKLVNQKFVDRIENNKLVIDYVNIQGSSKILNFGFQKSENIK